MQHVGNWKMVEDDGTEFIKVISFPVPNSAGFAGESMWVKKVEGTDNDGIGILDNVPLVCTEVKLGDLIRYGGGNDTTKPHFIERVLPS